MAQDADVQTGRRASELRPRGARLSDNVVRRAFAAPPGRQHHRERRKCRPPSRAEREGILFSACRSRAPRVCARSPAAHWGQAGLPGIWERSSRIIDTTAAVFEDAVRPQAGRKEDPLLLCQPRPECTERTTSGQMPRRLTSCAAAAPHYPGGSVTRKVAPRASTAPGISSSEP